jgi:hypothetical protein
MTGSPFTFLTRDLLSWQERDPIPAFGVSFGRTVNQPGAWTGEVKLSDPGVQELDWKNSTLPAKTALFIDIAGVLVWGGIIWTRRYQKSKATLKLTAAEFGSYFQRRLQAKDYTNTFEAGLNNGIEIAKRVISDAIEKESEADYPGPIAGTIALVANYYDGEAEPPVKMSYPDTSLQTIESIVNTLSQMGYGYGFDYSFDVAYLHGTQTPAVTLNFFFPTKGRSAAESGVVWLGNSALDYEWCEDGMSAANSVAETGASGLQPAIASGKTEHGWDFIDYPLLEQATARSQVTAEKVLERIALGDLARLGWPVATSWMQLPLAITQQQRIENDGSLFVFGEYDIGDRGVFRVDRDTARPDWRFPQGMSWEGRLVSWTCNPEGKPPQVQLNFEQPPLSVIPTPQAPL